MSTATAGQNILLALNSMGYGVCGVQALSHLTIKLVNI